MHLLYITNGHLCTHDSTYLHYALILMGTYVHMIIHQSTLLLHPQVHFITHAFILTYIHSLMVHLITHASMHLHYLPLQMYTHNYYYYSYMCVHEKSSLTRSFYTLHRHVRIYCATNEQWSFCKPALCLYLGVYLAQA